MTRQAGIKGLGHSVPRHVLNNQDLEQMVETSDEWIRTRTGIQRRHVVDDDTTTSDLAYNASLKALQQAGLGPQDLDLVIVATVTPDMAFPSTAAIIAERLGTRKIPAFDLEAACSGFLYALVVAQQFILSGMADHVLIVGAETLSKITNYSDRSTCVLFGDGAGAAVVGPVEEGYGILSTYLGADGAGADLLKLPAGGSAMPPSQATLDDGLHYIQQNGREVYKFAVNIMGEAAEEAVRRSGHSFDEIDLFVPHQANLRIIESAARRFDLPWERVQVTLQEYGNTSSASIPIAMSEAVSAGRVKRGDLVLMVAFGGGLTWGSSVMRWL